MRLAKTEEQQELRKFVRRFLAHKSPLTAGQAHFDRPEASTVIYGGRWATNPGCRVSLSQNATEDPDPPLRNALARTLTAAADEQRGWGVP